MKCILPWPPSVNRIWRRVGNRTILSKEARQYRKSVLQAVMLQGLEKFGSARLGVRIKACPPDRRRRDADNLLKPVFDALEEAGVYDDDWQFDYIEIERAEPVCNGRLEVEIWHR